jgi:ubiquitin-protein ligase
MCPRQDKDIKLTVHDNLYKWTAYLRGPEGTPFEGGCFQVLLDVQVHFCMPANAPAV